MLKRLSMVLAATAVMGICMAMVPQKAEAGWGFVTHHIKCALQGDGITYIDYTSERAWKDQQSCYAKVYMGWIGTGYRSAWTKQKYPYRKWHFRRVYVYNGSDSRNNFWFNVK